MRRTHLTVRSLLVSGLLCAGLASWMAVQPLAQGGPMFLPDDPLWVDNDRLLDAGKGKSRNLSQQLDFLENTFTTKGDRRDIRALNVNTHDEVPDSMWFTNRIGHRSLTDAEIVRGPDEFDALTFTSWTITGGKSSGLQPGFRAVGVGDTTGQLYQIEFDPPDHPDLATGAEMIGTGLYHALGYNVVENYIVHVDPDAVTIDPKATIRDRAGRPIPFTAAHLHEVFSRAHRSPDGTYRGLASRFAKGRPMGNFRYYGRRRDDPNDIYPHEHRRELRGNRVFSAWVNHDDSRAVNTLDMLEGASGAQYLRHYMFDFGSIMGSGTTGPDVARSGHAYLTERGASLKALATFGLWAPAWARQPQPAFHPSAGPFTADAPFDPAMWRAEYPNAASQNMRADDAFWAARRVAAFTDHQLRLLVGRARYTDAAATEQIAAALIERRNRVARVWLTGITPIVKPALSNGVLTVENAAEAAGVASPAARYSAQWSTFNNDRRTHKAVGDPVSSPTPSLPLPAALADDQGYIAAAVSIEHPDYPHWSKPVMLYFRRMGATWHAVGIVRDVPPRGTDEDSPDE